MPDVLAQQEIVDEIGTRLREAVTGDWLQLQYQARFCALAVQRELLVIRPDGMSESIRPPIRTGSLSSMLRKLMASPETGAWLSMTALITPDGQISAEFNYDKQPQWVDTGGGLPAAEWWEQELKQFPRAPENVPAWWSDLIASINPNDPNRRSFSIQAVMSPTGGDPAREQWTTTPETTAAADQFAAALNAAGYLAQRDADESDPDNLPDNVTNVFQLVDLDGGNVSFFDTGAFLSFSLGQTSHQDLTRFWTTVAAAAHTLHEQHGWTLTDDEQAYLDEQLRLGSYAT